MAPLLCLPGEILQVCRVVGPSVEPNTFTQISSRLFYGQPSNTESPNGLRVTSRFRIRLLSPAYTAPIHNESHVDRARTAHKPNRAHLCRLPRLPATVTERFIAVVTRRTLFSTRIESPRNQHFLPCQHEHHHTSTSQATKQQMNDF